MARNKLSIPDASILEAALAGLELQKKKVDEQIAQVKSMLGAKPAAAAAPAAAKPKPRRRLSEAARKRIAAAQKKRWAAFRASQKG